MMRGIKRQGEGVRGRMAGDDCGVDLESNTAVMALTAWLARCVCYSAVEPLTHGDW